MELLFSGEALQKACTEERESDRLWGADCAHIVRRRLVQFRAANSLAVLGKVRPANLRSLTGDRDGQFAVDVLPPRCIILEPFHDPVPTLPDGAVDKTKVTVIRVLAVVSCP